MEEGGEEQGRGGADPAAREQQRQADQGQSLGQRPGGQHRLAGVQHLPAAVAGVDRRGQQEGGVAGGAAHQPVGEKPGADEPHRLRGQHQDQARRIEAEGADQHRIERRKGAVGVLRAVFEEQVGAEGGGALVCARAKKA